MTNRTALNLYRFGFITNTFSLLFTILTGGSVFIMVIASVAIVVSLVGIRHMARHVDTSARTR